VRFRGSLIRRALLLGTLVAALLTSLASGSGSAAGDPDLVGEWHLDQIDGVAGTTPDSSGNGLTGRSVIATTTPGRFGNAFQFTNTGDGVDVPDDPALKLNRMTVLPYVLPDNVGPELAPIAGRELDSFTLAIGGTATLKVPVLGSVPLLNAYGLYEYPDYFEFGGGFSFGVSFLALSGATGRECSESSATKCWSCSLTAPKRSAW
jgi:hypothetical protein